MNVDLGETDAVAPTDVAAIVLVDFEQLDSFLGWSGCFSVKSLDNLYSSFGPVVSRKILRLFSMISSECEESPEWSVVLFENDFLSFWERNGNYLLEISLI